MTHGAELYLVSSYTRSVLRAGSAPAAVLLVLSLALGSAGCRKSVVKESGAAGRVEPSYNPDTGRLTRLAYDSNSNGKHDMWAYMDGVALIRLEADENEDGKIDRWEYYPPGATATNKKQPERIERSTRFDGRVTRREFFDGGQLARIEEDTDGNGVIDKWETYADGVLTLLALDTSGRGKADRRFIYRADGTLDRIEVDPEGTGNFQVVRQ